MNAGERTETIVKITAALEPVCVGFTAGLALMEYSKVCLFRPHTVSHQHTPLRNGG